MIKVINKVFGSVRFRFFHCFSISRRLSQLQRIYVKMLSKNVGIIGEKKPILTDFVLLSMTGVRHLEFLIESLYSIGRNWSAIPTVKVVTDGSIDPSRVAEALSFYPGRIVVENYDDLIKRLNLSHELDLIRFSESHVLGKKLCVILAHSLEDKPHLWTDADILWFRDMPSGSMEKALSAGLALSSDALCSYDPHMLSRRPALKNPPFYNSGLVMTSADIILTDCEDLLQAAAQNPHHFSEQTILASLAVQRGGPSWSLDQVFISVEDEHNLPLYPTCLNKPWSARHYACALKQFWRDAIYIRINS